MCPESYRYLLKIKNFRLFVVCGVLYVAHLIDAAYFGYFGNLFIYLFVFLFRYCLYNYGL